MPNWFEIFNEIQLATFTQSDGSCYAIEAQAMSEKGFICPYCETKCKHPKECSQKLKEFHEEVANRLAEEGWPREWYPLDYDPYSTQ